MKPTIKVSIGGTAFNLEENAYRLLKQYLDRLQAHYEKFDGGKEIVEDIELRITELLRERIGSPEQAISETVIKEIIVILGEPEEMESSEQDPDVGFSKKNKKEIRKKLYRDMDNRVLGGVCSGLAAYFNIDVVLIRILFVVFFIGFSILNFSLFGMTSGTALLVYVILWIVTPAARTVQQRHEMHGETPDIKNIQRKVEEELREAGRSIEKSAPAATEVFRIIGRIFLIFFGIILILIAVSVLMAFIIAFVSGQTVVSVLFADLLHYVDISWRPGWFFGLLAALLLLPFIGILYGGIKMLFNIKGRVGIGLTIFLLWIAALFTFVGMSIYHTKSFFHWRSFHESVELPVINHDILYVDIPSAYYTDGSLESVIGRVNHWGIHKKSYTCKHNKRASKKKTHRSVCNERDYPNNQPVLFFYKANKKANEKLLFLPIIAGKSATDEANFGLEIYREASGNNLRNAYRHAQEIPFHYTLKDSLLIIEPLIYTKDDKWDGELIRLHFQVPEGKKVVFGKAFGDKYTVY
ncbi:MAG: PspC domain-containing protein [Bacteroidetes bacterium]|nr:PspC domain-containing protein [Bacteroidota bacterium]MCL2302953.1 PspC domain-containing protein [Lentimicrobiaceae bacterium]